MSTRAPWARRLALLALVVGVAVSACGALRIDTRGPGVVANGRAADFTLPDERGAPVSLAELTTHGPAVLVFYRGYWWPVCRRQLGELESVRAPIEAAGGSLVGISVDTPQESAELAAKLGLHYRLLSDADLHVASAYGVAMEGRDIAVPAVFVVTPTRAIAWKKIGEDLTDRPTADEVLTRVRGG